MCDYGRLNFEYLQSDNRLLQPEILSDDENYAVLQRLTDHFEHDRPGGRSLAEDEEGTRRIAKGTVGLRLRVTRFDARAKLSQNKQPDVVRNVIARLAPTNPDLADEMRRVHPDGAGHSDPSPP
jgi:transcriptional regulator